MTHAHTEYDLSPPLPSGRCSPRMGSQEPQSIMAEELLAGFLIAYCIVCVVAGQADSPFLDRTSRRRKLQLGQERHVCATLSALVP